MLDIVVVGFEANRDELVSLHGCDLHLFGELTHLDKAYDLVPVVERHRRSGPNDCDQTEKEKELSGAAAALLVSSTMVSVVTATLLASLLLERRLRWMLHAANRWWIAVERMWWWVGWVRWIDDLCVMGLLCRL